MNEIHNAYIENTMLGLEDRGLLTSMIYLKWNKSEEGYKFGQGYGGYLLASNNNCSKWIYNILKTVGVDKWEDLKGKYVRVKLKNHTQIEAIGHIIDDNLWFDIRSLENNT